MTNDLSSAFGDSAAARLRGLLPPRSATDQPAQPAPARPEPPATRDRRADVSPSMRERGSSSSTAHTGGGSTPPERRAKPRGSSTAAVTAGRRWGTTRVVSHYHVDLLLLCALRHGPDHAQGIIERLREDSGGVLEAPERTVHRGLHRLTRNRFLARVAPGPRGGSRYRLTSAGERVVRARSRQWRTFARAVDAVVAEEPSS